MVNINVKLEASGAEIKYVKSTPYYFKAASLEIRGNRINLPKRAATTVEFNANSNLNELIDMTTDIAIIDKQLSSDSIYNLLHGTREFTKLHNVIDSSISKMRYSKMKGFLIRPQKNAKNIIQTKEDYERIYSYSKQIAIDADADFYGLAFPSNIPIDDVKDIWNRYVINRNSVDPYPIIFIDPSNEDYILFQYLIPYLKSHIKSGHFNLLGTYYAGPISMFPFNKEIITNFKDLDLATFTVGIKRQTNYESLSGIHGQELFMSDIVGISSNRYSAERKSDGTYLKQKFMPKAFLEKNLTINNLSSLISDEGNIGIFLDSISHLKSKELRDFINNIIQSKSIDEIVNNDITAADLGNAFKLHELEKSIKEIGISREFAKKGEISEYVSQTKPILSAWLGDVEHSYNKNKR